MADEEGLVQDAMRFAGAIHKYAASKGWRPEDYRIFMTVNRDLLTLRMTVTAKAFEGRTEVQEYADYDDLIDLIEAEVRPRGRVFNSYSLVLSGTNGFSSYLRPWLGPADIEIDETRINQEIARGEPSRPSA